MALYLQDTITLKNWTFNLGIRGDHISGHHASEPGRAAARASLTTSSRPSTVLQVSYARTMETPFNENLVLASVGCNDPVVNDPVGDAPGLSLLDGAADSGHAE